MGKRKMPGLVKRGNTWHIKKRIKGYGRLNETTGTADRTEAERYLAHRLEEIRKSVVYGERPSITVRVAAAKLMEESGHLRSLERIAYALDSLLPYIGDVYLEQLHDDTPSLKKWKAARIAAGVSASTINRDMDPIRRMFTLASRKWRHPNGTTYVSSAPLFERVPETDNRAAYPLNWDEQRAFFAELPPHLQRIALFDVNTGLRAAELTNLRWSWEVQVPELGCSVFVIPHQYTKNQEEKVVLLNDTARRVIEEQRATKSNDFVFTFRGHQLSRVLNSSWKKARKRAGLPQLRFHDLRHTFAHRLRAAGVSLEDRKALMGHTKGDITTQYSSEDYAQLLECVRGIERQDRGTVLRVVGAKRAQAEPSAQRPTLKAVVNN